MLYVGWPGVHVNSEYEKRQISDLLIQYDCVPVFPPEDELESFLAFSHHLLWPIFHDVMLFMMTNAQAFDEDQWASYQRVNHSYADVVIRCSHQSDMFWVHDYHLMLVPQYLTRKVRKANIGIFLHTPWPSYDIFRCLPVREELLRAILCADLVGFQLFEYARKFFVSTKRMLGLDYMFLPNGQLSLQYAGRNVYVKVAHVCISIDDVAVAATKLKDVQKAILKDQLQSKVPTKEKGVVSQTGDDHIPTTSSSKDRPELGVGEAGGGAIRVGMMPTELFGMDLFLRKTPCSFVVLQHATQSRFQCPLVSFLVQKPLFLRRKETRRSQRYFHLCAC